MASSLTEQPDPAGLRLLLLLLRLLLLPLVALEFQNFLQHTQPTNTQQNTTRVQRARPTHPLSVLRGAFPRNALATASGFAQARGTLSAPPHPSNNIQHKAYDLT